jgi:cytidine deaminase
MEEITLKSTLQKAQFSELTDAERQLIDVAKESTFNSYAPYSHFHVGAALLLKNGTIVPGCNQENAAFPSGLCAERSAIFAAQSQHPEHAIDALAIAAKNAKGLMPDPVSPCGGCRQVILEMEDRYKQPVRILLYGTRGVYCIRSVKDLMPLSFVDENMH